jgi:hypothetical protein
MGSPLPATDHNRKGGASLASLPEILTISNIFEKA